MSRQIQIRRGTAAEHENFTGAPGEVTMDTDAKTLRVHDGQTVGGVPLARADQIAAAAGTGGAAAPYEMPSNYDFVIASVSNGNSWYRKYESGWIEQGGLTTARNAVTALPIPMANANYYVGFNSVGGAVAPAAEIAPYIVARTTASITLYWPNGSSDRNSALWEVKGMAAS